MPSPGASRRRSRFRCRSTPPWFALKARIGDHVLDARAKHKDAAREDYEGAGAQQTAVLHEEVLRGVHMLSVGHVAPGAEIEVRSSFALAMTNLDGRATLRIPLTVGHVYGRSGLPDLDDLAHGGTLPPPIWRWSATTAASC